MKRITDDVTIFNLLEKEEQELGGLNQDNFFCFEKEEEFHLVLFTAKGKGKGFTMFVLQDYKQDSAELYELLFALQDKAYRRANSKIIFKAIGKVQEVIDSTEAKKLFFDAH